MTQTNLNEFFHDFRQSYLSGTEANQNWQLAEFLEFVTSNLTDAGIIDGFEFCHYSAQRGIRVDGYWFDDDLLYLFAADFECRNELNSLTKTEVDVAFKRLMKFLDACRNHALYQDLEETSPEYGLARQIRDRGHQIRRVHFFLISERILSERMQNIDNKSLFSGVSSSFHIWDISRLQRQQSSKQHKEPLKIHFSQFSCSKISCLPAHLGISSYQSYLVVMPASVLANLYELYGSRLLEQNVRCFLQARNKVNHGIKTTILNAPEMFFAYNNGITATAQEVQISKGQNGLELVSIKDLQIVNGGQTTASLFHTQRKDKASLEKIFVQMKLSVIPEFEDENVILKISEYANTQNRINAADFFSNHPFHIRMQDFSRRLWAPAKLGHLRETKWFYERARGQYADAQSSLTEAEKKRFRAEYPHKSPNRQMFTKTDLAKFENVWDEIPTYVNLGAQKNFAQYAKRIGQEWEKNNKSFNEFYYKRAIARAIIFRITENLVSSQPWYNGGYRANIVAYTLALISFYCAKENKSIDFLSVWDNQSASKNLEHAIAVTAKLVNESITNPEPGISNVTEWCKKRLCWERLQNRINDLESRLPVEFKFELISKNKINKQWKEAEKEQTIDDELNYQKRVMEISGTEWNNLAQLLKEKRLLSPKEEGIILKATQIPKYVPSPKESQILVSIILEKAEQEGISVHS